MLRHLCDYFEFFLKMHKIKKIGDFVMYFRASSTCKPVIRAQTFSFSLQDEVSPGRVGRTHRTIPPLAKGRGQFCSVKARQEDDRYVSHHSQIIDSPFIFFYHYNSISRTYFKEMFTIYTITDKVSFCHLIHISLFDGLDLL